MDNVEGDRFRSLASPARGGAYRARWRSWWIAVTYATRPLVWVLVCGALVAGVLDLLVGQSRPRLMSNYPAPPPSRLAVLTQESLEQVRANGREAEVDSIGLSSLWFSMHRPAGEQRPSRPPPAALQVTPGSQPAEEFYRVLDEFPKLRQVEYTCFGEPTGFERVTRLQDVEYLTLYGCQLDLATLQSWKKLRELTLYSNAPPKHIAALAGLPDLQTVVVQSRMAIDDARLAELAALPHLKVLVLNFSYYHPAEPRLTRGAFEMLAHSSSLETLYVGGQGGPGAELYALATESLPHVAVKPAISQWQMPGRLLFQVLPFLLLAVAIGVQLSSQFRSPLRRLAPAFASSQALVAIILGVIVTTLCTVRLVAIGARWEAAFPLSAALITSYIASLSLLSIKDSVSVVMRGRARFAQLLSAVMPVLTILLFFPDQADAILRGDPIIVAALWCATVASMGLGVWLLSHLVYWAASLDPLPSKGGRDMFLVGARYRENWLFAAHDREEAIGTWSQRNARDWSWWRRIERWRFGNPPLRIMRFEAVMVAVLLGVQGAVAWKSGSWSVLRSGFCIAAFLSATQGAMQVGGVWRARLLVAPLEIIRPSERRRMHCEWIAAFAADLLPSVLLASLLAALGVNWVPPQATSWSAVLLDFTTFLPVTATVTLALGGLVAVVERLWLALALGMFLIWAMPMAVLGAALLASIGHSGTGVLDITPQAIVAQAWVAAVIGGILAWILGRRFLRLEFGRRV